MRNIFLILILSPYWGNGQYENLKLEKGQIVFEKIYFLDSTTVMPIERLLNLSIPKLKDVSEFNKSSDIITAKITDCYIDYKKYGGKWGSTAAVLNHPFFGDVSIVWKENKYRVTVTNMYFNTDGLGVMKCSDMLLKKNRSELLKSKGAISTGIYIEKYLADLFLVSESGNDDW